MYKQVILVRTDLKMPKGKLAAQVSHASVGCVLEALKNDKTKKNVDFWVKEGMKKSILKIKNEDELMNYKKMADECKIVNSLIRDAGRTFFKQSTITCLGIGPDKEEKIDRITGKLKLL
ncbi:MAG: peptidyl-tRNA hydrolase Pth2 [Candidatus Woesearchaeota archaeon]